MRTLKLWAALSLALALAGQALAMPAQQAKDEQVVLQVMAAFQRGGFPALQKELPKLQKVLDHAPASFPVRESQGTTLIQRSVGGGPMDNLSPLLAAAVDGRKLTLVSEYNTYPMAALLLGSYAVEMRKPADALAPLDRGLAIQPENQMLVTEKAQALNMLSRHGEALALLDTWLRGDGLDPLDRSRMLRAKGFTLVNLERLDDAEQAYRNSLKIEPNHALAMNELEYIRRLKAGGEKKPIATITSDKAATEVPKE